VLTALVERPGREAGIKREYTVHFQIAIDKIYLMLNLFNPINHSWDVLPAWAKKNKHLNARHEG
jgi:hypothetical protein